MTQPTLDFVPTPAAGVESCLLDGERLVWHGPFLHRLDAVGALVWQCFDGHTTVADLARILAEEFEAPESDVQRDVSRLCADLLDEGLLEGGNPKNPEEPLQPFTMGGPPSGPLGTEERLHTTNRFRALDHDFAIRSDDARLAARFNRFLRSFAVPGSPARQYSVVAGTAGGERYRIYLDDEGLYATDDVDVAVRYILWHINYHIVMESSRHLLIHAAGATIGGEALVLPGEPNAGKTTLVAGLVLDGLGLLTDELVALNLSTGLVDPYPRPLNIGSGSWPVLPALRPVEHDERERLPRDAWVVDPASIRADAVAAAAPIRWVIAPKFTKGAPTRLEPLSRPEAVELLHTYAFNRHRFGSTGIRALVAAVGEARCCRLVNGDLTAAVAAVRNFVDHGAPSP